MYTPNVEQALTLNTRLATGAPVKHSADSDQGKQAPVPSEKINTHSYISKTMFIKVKSTDKKKKRVVIKLISLKEQSTKA